MHTFVSTALGKGARLILALAVPALAGFAQTPSLTTLYSFAGGLSGEYPSAGVIFGTGANSSNLFGTTPYGGNSACAGGCGTVYQLTPGTTWSETAIYTFQGGTDGAYPSGALTAGANGVLYGVTAGGGSMGNGTVFQLTPPAQAGGAWTETVLYSFQGIATGGVSVSGTTVSSAAGTPFVTGSTWAGSTLYIKGCTPGGCTNGAYTIASVESSSSLTLTTSAGTQTGVRYWVNAAPAGPWAGWPDGNGPQGTLTLLPNGKLYGATFGGGTSSAGAVFQLTPPKKSGPWSESVIYNLGGGKYGSGPESGVIVNKGNLYGATCCGTVGGTVFQLTPPATKGGAWSNKTLYTFASYSAGAFPFGGLVIDGNGVLYGTTEAGGASGAGIVFSLTAPAQQGKQYTLKTIHAFTNGNDGGAPYGNLILGTGGVLYATVTAGCNYGAGGVLQFTPPATQGGAWTESVLYSFTGANDGSQPFAGVALGSNNALYGTTTFDGVAGYGTVFELMP